MPSADRLHEFISIIDAGSISSAARTLCLPRATLSRRLSSLETELAVRLLHRGTRRLALTPAGEELYQRARRVVADTEAAWAALRRLDEVPRGPLRVSVPDSSATKSELFLNFAREFPEVQLELSTSSRHVDLVAEGIDVAVRFGPIADGSLIARHLWTTRSLAVASPAYLEAHGEPSHADELASRDCIVGFGGVSTPQRTWPLLDGGEVPIRRRLASSDLQLQIQAAREGLGIALAPRSAIAADLAEGRLCPVLDHQVGAAVPANLVFVDREFLPPQVRVFIERAVDFYQRDASNPV